MPIYTLLYSFPANSDGRPGNSRANASITGSHSFPVTYNINKIVWHARGACHTDDYSYGSNSSCSVSFSLTSNGVPITLSTPDAGASHSSVNHHDAASVFDANGTDLTTYVNVTAAGYSGSAAAASEYSTSAYIYMDQFDLYGYALTSWTDDGPHSSSARVLAGVTKIKKIHIDEMRGSWNDYTGIRGVIRKRGGVDYSVSPGWTDQTITSNTTKIKAAHINDLRQACEYAKGLITGAPNPIWTDSPRVVADTIKVKAAHINEIRAYINTLETLA